MAAPIPVNLTLAFAASGNKNTIPQAATGSELASFTQGFPPITMTPVVSGGRPPDGKDFNGILNQLSAHILWMNSGGEYKFDATVATAIGGYSKGMVLLGDDGVSSYISAVDNNSVNFNSTPASIGVQWIPFSQATSNVFPLNVVTTPTLPDAAAYSPIVKLTGTLTANTTVTVPAFTRNWVFLNAVNMGAFTLSIKAAGSSVVIPLRAASPVALTGDGTDLFYSQVTAPDQLQTDQSLAIANTNFVKQAVADVSISRSKLYYFGQF